MLRAVELVPSLGFRKVISAILPKDDPVIFPITGGCGGAVIGPKQVNFALVCVREWGSLSLYWASSRKVGLPEMGRELTVVPNIRPLFWAF